MSDGVDNGPTAQTGEGDKEHQAHPFRTLQELLDYVAGRSNGESPQESAGLSEPVPFPFLAIIGQKEMKLALVLTLINPAIGGILLMGPRGTAKTTAIRSLLNLLPKVNRSLCFYGCLPEDIETGGLSAVCPDCARKFAEGLPLAAPDPVRLVELPSNSRIDDVIGSIDDKSISVSERQRVRRGILARADLNLLYIDEVNLMANEIIDAILDAAAQGSYTVHRGILSATYHARFTLVGSMNPEEGNLRPQIQDRFGLRVNVAGLADPDQRLLAYHRVWSYKNNPRAMVASYSEDTQALAWEIQEARQNLGKVVLPDPLAQKAIQVILNLGIDSLRAEITWFEAARAYTAADGRSTVTGKDLQAVAAMALRMRTSQFTKDYLNHQKTEEEELADLINQVIGNGN